jgi:hypothetical protein
LVDKFKIWRAVSDRLNMDRVVRSLEAAIDSAVSLADDLKPQIQQKDLDEFTAICQKFIELRTKYMLMKTLEDNDFPSDFSSDKLNALRSQNDQMKGQIQSLQRSFDEIPREQLHALIDESRQTLSNVQAKLRQSKSSNLDELLRLAQEELNHLESSSADYGWYQDAYHKLSEFTGIEVGSDNTIRLLGTHFVSFSDSSVRIDPDDVFVGDLNPSTSSPGVCISEVIERLTSLNDLRSVAQSLGWRLEIQRNAPMVSLFPSNGSPPALFALIGYQEHPLVEWGMVDVDEFNGVTEPTVEKLSRFAKLNRK